MSADFTVPDAEETREAAETPGEPETAGTTESLPEHFALTEPLPEHFAPAEPLPVAAPATTRGRGRTRGRAVTLTALWLASALGVGAGTGVGILKATDHPKAVAAVAAPLPAPTPAVTSGVRSDGTHYGSIHDFLLPIPADFQPGPDDSDLGNDSSITPAELDDQIGQLFPQLQKSDLTSAKGAMESAHMTGGALRTYVSSYNSLDVELSILQLNPAMAAKATSDFTRVITLSGIYRTGPVIAGYPGAQCVLPPVRPGDKIDEMLCLGTVGDAFVICEATGTVPMDQQSIVSLFTGQLDLLKKGPAGK